MTFLRNGKREKKDPLDIEWHIGEYTRLSKEDGDKPESDSIQNQDRIINNHIKFLRQQGERISSVTVFSDDGYAGGNFKRPGYKRMIEMIEAGKINCIIFKDNSRLGRNYPELGRLMEEYFPQMGVRVISVLNNLDSFRDPRGYSSAIVSFSNMVNDDYIRQLSIKIKCTLDMKREQGEFIGNYAPYGYVKSEADRHKLEIDPEAAEVVKMIFDWYAGGMSAGGIVKQLNALKIMPPSVYKTSKGCKGFTTHSSGGVKTGVWALTSVNSMLRDEVYIGNLVQGKFKSESYRSKRMVQVDEDEWTVIEGTHEAIISDEQFTIVHERFARRTRVAPKKERTHMFSGFVNCGHCGHRMNRVVSQGFPRFRCPTRTYAPEKCQCSSVKEELLSKVVLSALQDQIAKLVDVKAALDKARHEKPDSAPNEYQAALRRAEQEKKRLCDAKFRLYDDLQQGIIDREEYELFRKRYSDEIATQELYIEKLNANLEELANAKQLDDDFIAFFKKYGNIEKLDRDILNHLLDHVEVISPNHIEVYFRFSGVSQKILDLVQPIEDSKQSDRMVC